jgi:hypothetical protein
MNEQHEERFVKEEYIDIDSYQSGRNCDSYFSYVLRKLIPRYDQFLEQVATEQGDKTDCAFNFLHDIVPYLASVVIQNGIYFIKDFPNHYFSDILKVSL